MDLCIEIQNSKLSIFMTKKTFADYNVQLVINYMNKGIIRIIFFFFFLVHLFLKINFNFQLFDQLKRI